MSILVEAGKILKFADGIGEVSHDDTLSGKGTSDSPLKVAKHLVSVEADSEPGYLGDRLVAGDGVRLTTSDGNLKISAEPSQVAGTAIIVTPPVDVVTGKVGIGQSQNGKPSFNMHAFTIPSWLTLYKNVDGPVSAGSVMRVAFAEPPSIEAKHILYLAIYKWNMTNNICDLIALTEPAGAISTDTRLLTLRVKHLFEVGKENEPDEIIMDSDAIYYVCVICDVGSSKFAGTVPVGESFDLANPYPICKRQNVENAQDDYAIITHHRILNMTEFEKNNTRICVMIHK